jgi:hypothetical protein
MRWRANRSRSGRSRCRCSRLRGSRWRNNWRRSGNLRRHRSSRSGRLRYNWFCRGRSRNRGRARFRSNWRHARLRYCRWRSRPHPRGLCSRVLRFFFRFDSRFYLRFLLSGSQNLFAHFLRDILGDRARVRLLLRDAIPRQQVNDGLSLDLQFAGQFVNSDLIYVGHALRS